MRNFFKYNDEIIYIALITFVLACMGLSRMNEIVEIYRVFFETLEDFTFLILVLICWGNSNENNLRLQRILSTLILIAGFNFIDSIFNFKEETYSLVFVWLLLLNIIYITFLPRWRK